MLRAAAFSLLALAGRALEGAGALLQYAAAGTLSLGALRTALARRWERFGSTETEAYRDSGLMPWEREFLNAAVKPGDRVLVVGCGTGRDVIALLRWGCRVDGIDIAGACVATARAAVAARGFSAFLESGTLQSVTLPARYDVVLFSWYCYSYLPVADARIATLRRAREALGADGRIVISYLIPIDSRRYRLIAATRCVARLTGSDWRPERGDVLMLGAANGYGVHYEHHFTKADFEAEVQAAGLRVASHEVADDGLAVLVP